MKIGAQLYSVRDYTKTPADIEDTLRRIKAIGFEVIQISGFGPCDIDLLAGWIKELGLDVCVTHTPWNRLADPAELKKVAAEHRKIGCPQVGLGAKPEDVFPNSYEGYTRFIKKANGICRILKNEGLTFGYHNHDFEFQKWNGVSAMDRIIEECPDMYFILDTFWVQAGGCNPVSYIKKLAGRIKVIHFKDYRIKDRNRQFAEIGEGNLDWDEIIPVCKETGIPYAVIEQDGDFLTDPFESLALSRSFLLKKG
ncbi:MAG: sugar phosphate isomerase/epimerase [Spirochaetaceae bacterium]|jgi:sugar phosphate isomerase/epimerase|nr:sugar phosphate isomerase/epimerase [Spirochaetaceae bacterium]